MSTNKERKSHNSTQDNLFQSLLKTSTYLIQHQRARNDGQHYSQSHQLTTNARTMVQNPALNPNFLSSLTPSTLANSNPTQTTTTTNSLSSDSLSHDQWRTNNMKLKRFLCTTWLLDLHNRNTRLDSMAIATTMTNRLMQHISLWKSSRAFIVTEVQQILSNANVWHTKGSRLYMKPTSYSKQA